jgi:hypothetical protein
MGLLGGILVMWDRVVENNEECVGKFLVVFQTHY